MDPVALQWLDNFARNYNVGQALLLAFVLTVLAVVPLKSWKVASLVVGVFGALFALVPGSTAPFFWRFLGFGLLVVAPIMYISVRD